MNALNSIADWLVNANAWAKSNDLSNWGGVIFTVIAWPTVLSLLILWWTTRKVNSISKLLVAFMPTDDITMGGASFPAVAILFENQTGSVVYVTGPRIRNCSRRFPIPTQAVRDIGHNWHPLSFWNTTANLFQDHQTTLQTSGKAQTTIAVMDGMPESFYRHETCRLRRLFRMPKYFIIEYTAMVGEKKYSVSTIY
jgi:hypothetical protein